ncbi:phytoene synthase [Halalkalibacter wakoensis JCM 9140]|uniref:Phytoene synthase n=1 Tax=Halalkalibacter wakoensis JCM 9140 TaxID=1236970 RepID=W4Q716_9BACI|nr:phytoene/squalene synthase family protein [Halalkalibacter wakoensis]GAE27760.1 phytoene synthase [Halalkalibacter wakoensis JCM 9140]
MNYIDLAYEKCREVIEQNSKSFAKAFSILPAPKRKAVWAVYAFCRRVDDIVDENGGSVSELYEFEKQFKNFLEHTTPMNDFMWIALRDVFSRYDMNTQPFFDMIKGQKLDFEKTTYDTINELEMYAYHVASTVGLMLLPILAPATHNQLKEGAVSLGLAMQLTNILRDVGEDLHKGRIYLPKEIMDLYDYKKEDLQNHVLNDNFIKLWEDIANRAEGYYEEALQSMELYPEDSRLPVQSSLFIYRGILQAVRENDYEVFTKRAFVSKDQMQQIVTLLLTRKEGSA